MSELKIEIEDATHRNLLSRGSIPNPSYNKRARILPPQTEEFKNEEIKEKDKLVWESCCFNVNPHGVAYLGQFIVTMSVLSISTYMLLKADGSCEKSSPYIGLISFVLGKILSSVVSST